MGRMSFFKEKKGMINCFQIAENLLCEWLVNNFQKVSKHEFVLL